MEPLGIQRDYVSQQPLGSCACVRLGWLEDGRGRKREGGRERGRASLLRVSLVPRSGEGRVTGDAAVEEVGRGTPAERAHCRRGGAEGALGCSSVPPALSPPESPGGRAEKPRCRSALPLCPGIAAVSRSLQAPGSAGEAGLERPQLC